MPDIDEVLQQVPNALQQLIEMAKDEPPIAPDIDQVRKDIENRLTWVINKDGERVRPNSKLAKNVYIVLSQDPEFAQSIWFNEFTGILRWGYREMKDTDATWLRMRIYDIYGFEPSKGIVDEVVEKVADENKQNPLVDWLESLKWDGRERLDDYIIKGLGARDIKLHRMIGRKWLIQAVARAMRPGCKADASLILMGGQGTLKSTSLQRLAGEDYFSDTPIDVGNRRAYLQMQHTWIYELSELESIKRRENSQVKAFLTSTEDTFVPPYGRRIVRQKRHTVFCGTTNKCEFLTDSTGSRRFWPVKVGEISLKWIDENREQLWAEAVFFFKAGEAWWMDAEAEEELAEHSEQFREEDPWFGAIEDWLRINGYREFTTRDIMLNALKFDNVQMNRAAEMRIADLLSEMGFLKVRGGIKGQRAYVWKRDAAIYDLSNTERKNA